MKTRLEKYVLLEAAIKHRPAKGDRMEEVSNKGLATGDLVRVEASLMKGDAFFGMIVSISDPINDMRPPDAASPLWERRNRGRFRVILYDILMNHDGQVWTCASTHFKVWKIKDEPRKRGGG